MEKKGTWEACQGAIYTNRVLCQKPRCAQERFRVAFHGPFSQPVPADNLGMSHQVWMPANDFSERKTDEGTTESPTAEGI